MAKAKRERTPEEIARSNAFARKWLPLIICGVLMVGGIGTASVIQSGRDSQLAEQNTTIHGLENRIDTLEAAQSEDVDKAVQLASGLDSARVAQDDEAARALLEQAFNWDSKETYDAARNSIKEMYGLSDDSSFLSVFMPEMGNINVGDREINEIDARGLNISFSGMQSNVTAINGDLYTYFTIVTVTSSDSTGATADGESAFVYTVNGNGELSDLAAYALG